MEISKCYIYQPTTDSQAIIVCQEMLCQDTAGWVLSQPVLNNPLRTS